MKLKKWKTKNEKSKDENLQQCKTFSLFIFH